MANSKRPPRSRAVTAKVGASQAPKADAGTTRGTPKTGTKSAFILGFSHDTPSRIIVEAGASKGLRFTQSYVATIRALERKRTGVKATRSVGRPRNSASTAGTTRSFAPMGDGLESQFARLALDLGLARAEAVLQRLQSHLDTLAL